MGRPKLPVDLATYSGRFSDRLTTLREQRDMTVDELSHRLGVALKTVYHWESGIREPSLNQIRNIAKALNVSVRHLMPEV